MVMRDKFYRIPKFLHEGCFKGLGNDARVLYGLLLDRHGLSIKNQWINERGEVYFNFKREEMAVLLELSENTVNKAMKNLKQYKLIDEERIGQNKPNRIYLLTISNLSDYEAPTPSKEVKPLDFSGTSNFTTPLNTRTLKFCGSGIRENP
jgi:hypothetical protein